MAAASATRSRLMRTEGTRRRPHLKRLRVRASVTCAGRCVSFLRVEPAGAPGKFHKAVVLIFPDILLRKARPRDRSFGPFLPRSCSAFAAACRAESAAIVYDERMHSHRSARHPPRRAEQPAQR